MRTTGQTQPLETNPLWLDSTVWLTVLAGSMEPVLALLINAVDPSVQMWKGGWDARPQNLPLGSVMMTILIGSGYLKP